MEDWIEFDTATAEDGGNQAFSLGTRRRQDQVEAVFGPLGQEK